MNKNLIPVVALQTCLITLFAYLSYYFIKSPLIATALFFMVCTIEIIVFSQIITKRAQQTFAELPENIRTHTSEDLADIGGEISNQASELAINSAEISFFLGQLSASIENSSQDVDRLATAAEEMSANSKQINDNAMHASQQASKQAML